jgi:Major Facilitator Superfamily
VILYRTRWFRIEDRARAIAVFYASIPIGMLIGSSIASWLLGIHWLGFPGWRWLFIREGIPAILLGIATLFYLTDHPSEADWLSASERCWIVAEIDAERAAKKKHRDFTFWDACRDPRILLVIGGYFFFQLANIANSFWLPSFLKRLSGLPPTAVSRLVIFPRHSWAVGPNRPCLAFRQDRRTKVAYGHPCPVRWSCFLVDCCCPSAFRVGRVALYGGQRLLLRQYPVHLVYSHHDPERYHRGGSVWPDYIRLADWRVRRPVSTWLPK